MSEIIHLGDIWKHTITKILKQDSNLKLGTMIRQWVRYNKLEDLNSLLNFTVDDFTPSGNLC